MKLENSFEVPAPVERVWSYLLDVERVVPCMPGAELTETIDERNWKGKIKIKVGPVSLQFAGKVTMQERDDHAHKVILKANGIEQRGMGAASATVSSTLEPVDGGRTRVVIVQNLNVQGQVAQMSRGMLPDVTANLTGQFADCIRSNLEAQDRMAPGERSEEARAGDVRAISLGASALWQAIRRFFRKLFGKA